MKNLSLFSQLQLLVCMSSRYTDIQIHKEKKDSLWITRHSRYSLYKNLKNSSQNLKDSSYTFVSMSVNDGLRVEDDGGRDWHRQQSDFSAQPVVLQQPSPVTTYNRRERPSPPPLSPRTESRTEGVWNR